jgi:hypothetical protein
VASAKTQLEQQRAYRSDTQERIACLEKELQAILSRSAIIKVGYWKDGKKIPHHI